MSRHREEDPHMNFNILKVRNVKITDMNLAGMAVTNLRVKTTKCDETCARYDMDKFCPERRWIHETTKLYRRRMLMGKKKHPVCLLRRKIAEDTGCLKEQNKGPRIKRISTVEVPTY